jgi:hypothetical protein
MFEFGELEVYAFQLAVMESNPTQQRPGQVDTQQCSRCEARVHAATSRHRRTNTSNPIEQGVFELAFRQLAFNLFQRRKNRIDKPAAL